MPVSYVLQRSILDCGTAYADALRGSLESGLPKIGATRFGWEHYVARATLLQYAVERNLAVRYLCNEVGSGLGFSGIRERLSRSAMAGIDTKIIVLDCMDDDTGEFLERLALSPSTGIRVADPADTHRAEGQQAYLPDVLIAGDRTYYATECVTPHIRSRMIAAIHDCGSEFLIAMGEVLLGNARAYQTRGVGGGVVINDPDATSTLIEVFDILWNRTNPSGVGYTAERPLCRVG